MSEVKRYIKWNCADWGNIGADEDGCEFMNRDGGECVAASDYDTLAAQLAQLQADMEGGWENAWLAQVERLRARVVMLEDLIAQHNAGCDQSCFAQGEHGRCSPYKDRGTTCHDCPKEWAIEFPPADGGDA